MLDVPGMGRGREWEWESADAVGSLVPRVMMEIAESLFGSCSFCVSIFGGVWGGEGWLWDTSVGFGDYYSCLSVCVCVCVFNSSYVF